jgi:hypothetical protein
MSKLFKIIVSIVLLVLLFAIGLWLGNMQRAPKPTDNAIIPVVTEIVKYKYVENTTIIPTVQRENSKIDTAYPLFEPGSTANTSILVGDVISYTPDDKIELQIVTPDDQRYYKAVCSITPDTQITSWKSNFSRIDGVDGYTAEKSPLQRTLNTKAAIRIVMKYDTEIMDYNSSKNICIEINEIQH